MKDVTQVIHFPTPHECQGMRYVDDLFDYMASNKSIGAGNYTLTCTIQKAITKEGLGRVSLAYLTVKAFNPQQDKKTYGNI